MSITIAMANTLAAWPGATCRPGSKVSLHRSLPPRQFARPKRYAIIFGAGRCDNYRVDRLRMAPAYRDLSGRHTGQQFSGHSACGMSPVLTVPAAGLTPDWAIKQAT
jgi:hypothetical protein